MHNKLQEILSVLTKEEKNELKTYFKSLKSNSKSRKDLRLLYLIVDKEIYNDEELLSKIYPSKSPKNINAFRRLKNRITEEIIKYLTTKELYNNELLKNLIIAKFFHNKNNLPLALHFLKKSEELAIENENYNVLDDIYTMFINISIDSMTVNPEEYIRKREQNYEKLVKLREIENAVAVAIYKIRTEQNFNEEGGNLTKALQKIFSEIIVEEEHLSKAFKKQVFKAISRTLLQQHNYNELLKYSSFFYEKEKEFYEPDFLIEIIIFIMNSAYKLEKHNIFKDFYKHFNETFDQLSPQKQASFKFYTYYYQALLKKIENKYEETIEHLKEALEDENIKKHPLFKSFCQLNISIMYHNLGDLDKTLEYLNKLLGSPSIKKLASLLVVKILIFEIMVFCELDEMWVAKSKIESLKKFLKNNSITSSERDADFLKILNIITKKNKKDKLQEKITEFLQKYKNNYEDIVNYNTWLKKFLEKPEQVK